MVEQIIAGAKVFCLPPEALVPRVVPFQFAEIPVPPKADTADTLFETLLWELLQDQPIEKNTSRPEIIPAERSGAAHPVQSPVEGQALDYNRIWDYLGKLRTATEPYAALYNEQEKTGAAFHNDGGDLSWRIIERELRREFFDTIGLRTAEYTDPFERERYASHMKLVSVAMREIRQKFAIF